MALWPYQSMLNMRTVAPLCFTSLYAIQTLCSVSRPTLPLGTFVTECHERNFWLSIKSSVLGYKVRFDIEDDRGIHFLSGRQAAECGYSILHDHHGNLVLRVSYLACYVDSEADSEFRLQVWIVSRQPDGSVRAYPLHLHCRLPQPWSPRDILCEENYMEVSVVPQFSLPHNQTKLRMDAPPMSNEERRRLREEGRVLFYRPGDVQQQSWTVAELLSLGYVIAVTDHRVVLRAAYSSPQSHRYMDKEVLVEAVSAVFLLPSQGLLTVVDVSVACMINDVLVDREHLVWSSPLELHPLVQGVFQHRGVRLGLGTQALSECSARDRGYQVATNDGVLQVRIPFGADGTLTRAVEVDGELSQVISFHLFLLHEWQDDLLPLTQHRTFRLLQSPHLPHTPEVINDTVCAESIFSVTVGMFPREMFLKTLYIGEDSVALPEAQHQGLHITPIHYRNGSHIYQLRVPFSYPSVAQKRIRGGYKRRSLAFTLTLGLGLGLTSHEFNYTATVVCDEKEAADSPPWLEGMCGESGVQVRLHYGSGPRPWELYVGHRRLDWELVELGQLLLEVEDDHLSMDIPLSAPGITYENITLQSIVATVEVSVVDLDTFQVPQKLTQHCSFPGRDLLVCLPEGRMVVIVDTSRSIPPTPPNSTTLVDPSCGPSQTDSTRALFNFSLNSCGTTQTMDGGFLVYENQVVYRPDDLDPTEEPAIHRHPPYRLTIQCRFPMNRSDLVSFWRPVDPLALPLTPSEGHQSKRELPRRSIRRGKRTTRNLYGWKD
ncbi:uncharacterized protein LOC134437667 isoform X2 [Engraulis encrasicolus]|uniref:uncharacterized protein LOC134437667 isoform X2 n=1 Tax=Engraulis encrasicolus TaxID=184585 RepID=UPI002FD086A9